MKNIVENGFIELSNDEMENVDGGWAWYLVIAGMALKQVIKRTWNYTHGI